MVYSLWDPYLLHFQQSNVLKIRAFKDMRYICSTYSPCEWPSEEFRSATSTRLLMDDIGSGKNHESFDGDNSGLYGLERD